jgi:hypothetical protein
MVAEDKKNTARHEIKNTNYFPLKQGQTNSTENQRGWAPHSWKEATRADAISLADRGDVILDPPF